VTVNGLKQRQVGQTAVLVTELGFGGGPAGNLYVDSTDEQTAAAMDRAWAAGIRYFDTAPHYGLGLSERRLGAALRDQPREVFVLSTKVGRVLEPNPAPTGSDLAAEGFAVPDDLLRRWDFSAAGVRRSLEDSLQRLGASRVDVVYVHDADEHVDEAISGAIPELIRMRDEGTIGAVGVGMNQWQAPLRMVRETDLDVVMLAGRWTLLDRSGQPLLDECAARGVAVVAAAPYNSGLLAQAEPPDDAYFDYAPAGPELVARARTLAGVCAQHGVTLPDAAIQFPLRHPAVVSVVTGMRSGEEVDAALARSATAVPAAAWAELDAG
jgi:D-threo-aldose 1-dehydrogenase